MTKKVKETANYDDLSNNQAVKQQLVTDTENPDTDVWSEEEIGSELNQNVDDSPSEDKRAIIHCEYYSEDHGGLPALPRDGSSPFKFSINALAPEIDINKIFIVAAGWKTNTNGDLLTPLQITWSVNYTSPDYYVEFTIRDNNGTPYDPDEPEWEYCFVKLNFHAYYAETIASATFMS